MKKVVHFIDSDDPGGAETLIIEICNNLDKSKYMPEIYHFGNQWLEQKCIEHNLKSVIVPNHRFYKSILTLPIFIVLFTIFINKRKVDVIHSHLFDAIIASCLPAYLCGIRHIGTLHDIYSIENNKKRIILLKLATLLKSKIIAVSNQIKDYLINIGGMSESSIALIENGVDLNKFNCIIHDSLLKLLHIKYNQIVIICVGRLVEIKAHDVLLKAFKIIIQSGLSSKLLVIGDGPEKIKSEKFVMDNDLIDNVIFLGQRDDVPDLLSISDIFVLPSRSEGLSCSIIEAMAAKLPIVATDVGGNSELVQDGYNGYLVPVDDPIVLAEKIELLIENSEIRNRFSKNSNMLAQNKFSLRIMLDKYSRLYDYG
ncbi:MAG: glycosyltransferase [Gammaproteobacteria bacterium]|nr:glycosyltransferase [Gammaproteobacteria bacterium]